ncbi:MAG: M14 family zinc carboxypeptidase [Ignavibacteria bacterium]|nr:M14 family zinc carboxypeptidase [Ignavibacteria bacterium]
MKNLSLTIIVLLIVSSLGFAQNYKQVKIHLNNLSDVEELYRAGFDFDHPHFTKDNSIIVFVDDEDFSKLILSGYNFEILIDNWQQYYDNLPKLSDLEKQQALNQIVFDYGVTGFGFGSMGGYYTLAEVIEELDSMKLLYPNLISTKLSIGTSIESSPIYMVKISNNPNVNEDEPELLYTALHHAREPEGMMQMIFYMYYLLENYGTDPEVTYLVDNREMFFIPVVNPDGYEYNRQTNPNGGGMWRKNRRNNGGGIYGVDLNRNYGPYKYWNAPNGGSSTDPGSNIYRGTAPFSEPETSTIRAFLATRNLKNTLNYHTYSNLLIYPYGALEHETPDSLIFREFARDMTVYNGYVYGTDQQTVGYSTRGNSDDYFYDGDTLANGAKIFAMTPEVGSFSDGFWPPQSRIIPLAEENIFPNLYYAWVAGSYVGLDNTNYSQQFFNPGDVVELIPVFKNKGLSDGSNIEAQLNSLSSFVTIINGTENFAFIPARETADVSTPFSISILASTPVEEEIALEFVTSFNANVMRKDTIKIIIGTPSFIFADTTNDPANFWTITATPSNPKWETMFSTYYSSPTSYTDSKNGNYSDDATVTMTLTNPLDLTEYENPRLSFWTRWNIEGNWDYGQVEVSTNNGGSWIPLDGNYTEPGVGSFQPNGEPLYDGVQSTWVREEISLTNYNSSQFKIRFQLSSDGFVTRDGWYVDDIGIIVYTIIPVELTSFIAEARSESVILNWSTATELNNLGFEIERTKGNNNFNWVRIGFVEGNGTSTETNNYVFKVDNPFTGTSYYRLKQIDYDGTFRVYDEVQVDFHGVTDYALEQNYPNPFNPSTTIRYSIPAAGRVKLTLYNLLGSEVAVLVNEQQEAGKHSVIFSTEELGKKIGSGMYLYNLKSGSFTQTRKMIVLK